jgi:hypothetical protein
MSEFIGDLVIAERTNSTGQLQLWFSLGRWGLGWLRQIATCNRDFLLELQTDVKQVYYSAGFEEVPEFRVTYMPSNSLANESKPQVLLRHLGEEFAFDKDVFLSDRPEHPWEDELKPCDPDLVK